MATLLRIFFSDEDELAFLRFLERHKLEVYPRRIPPDWRPFLATPQNHPRLPEEDFYLADPQAGPVLVDRVKRGKDQGSLRVDEVRSPVIFFERCRPNEAGELVSGQIWAELEITQQTGRRDAAPERFRRLFKEVEEYLSKNCRRSEPRGFLIGPHAARRYKEGLVLRDSEPPKRRKKGQEPVGGIVRPFR